MQQTALKWEPKHLTCNFGKERKNMCSLAKNHANMKLPQASKFKKKQQQQKTFLPNIILLSLGVKSSNVKSTALICSNDHAYTLHYLF